MNTPLAYDDIGSGTPLLFMHGLGADRRQTTSALAEKIEGCRLIAPDFPGHGQSPPLSISHAYSFDYFADLVISLLDSMEIQKAHIGGLSMGAGVSLNIALRYPERVDKLILLRPSWLDTPRPEHLKLVADAGHLIEDLGLEQGERSLEALEAYQDILTTNAKVALSINGVYQRPHAYEAAHVLYKMWESCPFSDLAELHKVQNTSLVLHTTRDDLHPISVAKSISNALPNSTSQELPPRYYQPENYASALLDSLRKFLR